MIIHLALAMKQLRMPTKPFLIFCTLLAVTAQPALGMQTPAQSSFYSTHKKSILTSLGITALMAAIATHFLLTQPASKKKTFKHAPMAEQPAPIAYTVRRESDETARKKLFAELKEEIEQDFERPAIKTKTYITALPEKAPTEKDKDYIPSLGSRIWSRDCQNTAQIDFQIHVVGDVHIHTLTAKHEKNGDQHVYEDCIYGEPKFKLGHEPQEQVQ